MTALKQHYYAYGILFSDILSLIIYKNKIYLNANRVKYSIFLFVKRKEITYEVRRSNMLTFGKDMFGI